MFESEEQPELEQSNVSDQMQRFNCLGNLTKRSVTAIGVLTSNGKPDFSQRMSLKRLSKQVNWVNLLTRIFYHFQ